MTLGANSAANWDAADGAANFETACDGSLRDGFISGSIKAKR